MVPTSLRDRCADGTTAFGAWISLRDPLLVEAAALAGFDYVVVDMQHGLTDSADVIVMLHAMAHTPTLPVVRVPWNEPGIIGRVLDAGALGVIIPLVNSAAEARACRRSLPVRAGRGTEHRADASPCPIWDPITPAAPTTSSPASR